MLKTVPLFVLLGTLAACSGGDRPPSVASAKSASSVVSAVPILQGDTLDRVVLYGSFDAPPIAGAMMCVQTVFRGQLDDDLDVEAFSPTEITLKARGELLPLSWWAKIPTQCWVWAFEDNDNYYMARLPLSPV